MYKQAIPAVLLLSVLVASAGCTKNPGSQMKQQGTQMQQQMQQATPTAGPLQTTLNNRVDIANRAADKIVQLNEVKRANVLVTGQNAYVAAVVDTNQGQMTKDLEEKIAGQVRSTDPNIRNVYVSTNPEFVDRVNQYVKDVREGKPVTGFFEEFTSMIQRVFPKAR